jgi:hypothetical protein
MRRARICALRHAQDAGIDHGGFYILVTEKFLNGADIVVVLQKVGGEGMTKSVLLDFWFRNTIMTISQSFFAV